jgi:hypothetical protein
MIDLDWRHLRRNLSVFHACSSIGSHCSLFLIACYRQTHKETCYFNIQQTFLNLGFIILCQMRNASFGVHHIMDFSLFQHWRSVRQNNGAGLTYGAVELRQPTLNREWTLCGYIVFAETTANSVHNKGTGLMYHEIWPRNMTIQHYIKTDMMHYRMINYKHRFRVK